MNESRDIKIFSLGLRMVVLYNKNNIEYKGDENEGLVGFLS